jgi:hypothetical protein
MATFTSPRFAGNPTLEEILNDPDTGTKKLQKGSPPDAVLALQQALYDLGWAHRVAAIEPVRFVDGDYGPATVATVTDYKTLYRIVFPPGDPNGFIDGFTGPRTLQRLDRQMTFLDTARAEIIAKVQAMQAAGIDIELVADDPAEPPRLHPILGSGKAVSWFSVVGQAQGNPEAGEVVDARGIGPFELHGAVYRAWLDEGGTTGQLGCPTSDTSTDDTGDSSATFEGGSLLVGADGSVTIDPGPVAVVIPGGDEAIV